MALPRANRLKNKKDFDSVFKNGNAVKGSFLLIKYKTNNDHNSRFGIIIPSRVVKNSTARNHLKRFFTESIRKINLQNTGHKDIIIVLNKKADDKIIQKELEDILTKIKP